MSHTGNATGNFQIQGLKGSRVLTPFVAAQNLRSVLYCWYNADFLEIDANGLVAGATDLTRHGNHGTQSNATNRLIYFPNDALFGGKPSFGSINNTPGFRHILVGGTTSLGLQARIILSVRYGDGVISTFSALAGLAQGGSTSTDPRAVGQGSTWFQILGGGTFSKNGAPPLTSASSVLPLPASTLVLSPGSATASYTWNFGCDLVSSGRNWIGGYRNMIISNSLITPSQIALIEGVMAWDGGHQDKLVSTHPYRYCPPSIRD